MTQPEVLQLADDRPTSLGDDLYQWAIDAEGELRRLHAVNQELLVALVYLTAYAQQHGVMPAALTTARAAIAKGETK